MAYGVMYVKQLVGGKHYTTSWGLFNSTALDEDALFDEADWSLFTSGDVALADVLTGTAVTTSAPYDVASSGLVGAILAFHRYLQSDLVTIKGVYVTDGRKNSAETSAYVSLPLNLPCLGTIQGTGADSPDSILPASLPLMLGRSSVAFGGRPGRCFLRACLRDSDVRIGGDKGVDWSPGQEDFWGLKMADALLASSLTAFLSTGAQDAKLGVPHYASTAQVAQNPALEGTVVSMSEMAAIAVQAPTPRQVGRGRKRS